jgi:hypothetical protein
MDNIKKHDNWNEILYQTHSRTSYFHFATEYLQLIQRVKITVHKM